MLLCGCDDSKLYLVDMETNDIVMTFVGHTQVSPRDSVYVRLLSCVMCMSLVVYLYLYVYL